MSSIANQTNDISREVTYATTGASYTATYDCYVYFRVPTKDYNSWIGIEVDNSSPNSSTSTIVGTLNGWSLRYGASTTDKANALSRGFEQITSGSNNSSWGSAIGRIMLKKGETLYSQYSGLEYYVEKI